MTPLFPIASTKLCTFCSLVIFGVSFANSGFEFGMLGFVVIMFLLFSGFGGMPGAQFGITLPNPSGGSAHRNRSVQPCCLQPDDLLVEKPPEVMAQCFD